MRVLPVGVRIRVIIVVGIRVVVHGGQVLLLHFMLLLLQFLLLSFNALIERIVTSTPVQSITTIDDVERIDRKVRDDALAACAALGAPRAASGG